MGQQFNSDAVDRERVNAIVDFVAHAMLCHDPRGELSMRERLLIEYTVLGILGSQPCLCTPHGPSEPFTMPDGTRIETTPMTSQGCPVHGRPK